MIENQADERRVPVEAGFDGFSERSPVEDFQVEVLFELRSIVEILDKINDRLSVIDSLKIPSWLRKS